MSITQETLQQHLKDPAIFCCRREKGLVISAADLEDPSLFDDMVEAGLLTLSDDGLRIEQVIGSTLLTDVEALTPITRDVLDKINEVEEETAAAPEEEKEAPAAPAVNVEGAAMKVAHGKVVISIKEGKDIYLELPV